MHIILASNSPRRKELLAGLGIPYDVFVLQGIDESYPDDLPANEVAEYIARKRRKRIGTKYDVRKTKNCQLSIVNYQLS